MYHTIHIIFAPIYIETDEIYQFCLLQSINNIASFVGLGVFQFVVVFQHSRIDFDAKYAVVANLHNTYLFSELGRNVSILC